MSTEECKKLDNEVSPEESDKLSTVVKTMSTIENELHSKDSIDAAYDIVSTVDSLLEQLSHKFENLSTEILEKMDKMTKQLDALETSLNEMMAENHSTKMGKEIDEF
ncbi:unnamed protein product [Pneumocystis jirovecii]|uniref:Uncharacterized protein n=2 Tax=Pneumocystis jirovecii TaxID=42068 RepID=L0P8A0_PNEJI|nr:uncharacterized protein T551_00073 [Pneumocystis jirovecii RU7]KTW32588.1 hypothetical protein T551_00073 [Pneumocystis jirovecii RU7]CCJ28608.1 unnamed protein product [Pneumocystis jirovecii]